MVGAEETRVQSPGQLKQLLQTAAGHRKGTRQLEKSLKVSTGGGGGGKVSMGGRGGGGGGNF